MTSAIILTQGYVTIVDDEDYERLCQHNWSVQIQRYRNRLYPYAARGVVDEGRVIPIRMHRVIVGAASGERVDHWNGDTLDNQRHNLRKATNSQNIMNSQIRSDNKSGFKGVHFDRQLGRYRALLRANGRRFEGGLFDNPIDAAISYNRLAIDHHGEFARLNIIPQKDT